MEQVLTEAIRFIELAADNNHGVQEQTIKDLYNSECDEQDRVNPDVLSLACTVAIGAITEQKGSNIQSLAAMDNLAYLLGHVSS